MAGEDDMEAKRARNRLTTHVLCKKMIEKYPDLEWDDLCFVVPLLNNEDVPNPKYDIETASSEILHKLSKRRAKKKTWQEMEENTDSFDPDFDSPTEECLIDVVQTLQGCWDCGATNPMKTCSKCKLARYCNADCQRKNWKKSNTIIPPGHTTGVVQSVGHKEECKMWVQCRDRDQNGGPVAAALKGIGIIKENAMINMAMEKRTTEFLDELVRCNESSREIIKLNIGIAWNWGHLPCLQGTAQFFDDTATFVEPNFVLFKALEVEDQFFDKMRYDEGCGDIADREKNSIVAYLNNFFKEARDREIKIREVRCLRAMLWLCSPEYKGKLVDPNGEDERQHLFDPGHGPAKIVAAEKYASYLPGVLRKISRS